LRVALTLLNAEEKILLTLEEYYLGKVKTEQIKHLGKELMARFPEKFNTNFDDNKKQVDALTKGPTTRVRNKVAGYITRTYALALANKESGSDLEETEEMAE
jgi:small subunit ribosomal protein S17e